MQAVNELKRCDRCNVRPFLFALALVSGGGAEADAFRITGLQPLGGDQIELTWSATTNAYCSVERSTNLAANEFTLPALNLTNTSRFVDSVSNGPAAFYRMVASPTPLQPPVAVIETNAPPTIPVNATLHLSGATSFSPQGWPITHWQWSVDRPAGSQATILPATNAANPTFRADVPGAYTFHLQVWDNHQLPSQTLAAWSVSAVVFDNYHTDVGLTNAPNELIYLGTTNRDVILQVGGTADDTLYSGGGPADDWIAQQGGSGKDTIYADAGESNDCIFQEGGEGDDSLNTDGAAGDDWSTQRGGAGIDTVTALGGDGNDTIMMDGGPGSDAIYCDPGPGNDTSRIDSGTESDTITYICGAGIDIVFVDGGEGDDQLTVNKNYQLSFRIVSGADQTIYQLGDGGSTTITVANLEHITVVDQDGKPPLFHWDQP